MGTNNTSVYNLKAVVQETGLKPDTLRAWERRYGVPNPERTKVGHRIYSQDDINMLKWLVARQEDGLSISRAVDLWQQLKAEGKNPFDIEPSNATENKVSMSGSQLASKREDWIAACLDFDEAEAESVLSQAFAMHPAETVCYEVLQRGMAQLGQGWHQGKVSVQQEHFASALAMRRLESLISATPKPTRTGRILTACPPLEQHTFGPLMVSLLLRRRGWEVIYLGANVPIARLEGTIEATKPLLVVLIAQQLRTAATLQQMATVVNNAGIPLAFGGGAFATQQTLIDRIPGHYLGHKITGVPNIVENLLQNSALVETPTLPEQYAVAIKLLQEKRPLIEADIWQTLQADEAVHAHINQMNQITADNIIAALRLGNIDFLGHSISWFEQLFHNFDLPNPLLIRYIQSYHNAVIAHLGDQGTIVSDWIGKIANSKN